MTERRHGGKGWIIGCVVLFLLLIGSSATNYMKADKIKTLNDQLSAAQAKESQTTQAQSQAPTSTPSISMPNPIQPVATKQSWLCNSSLYTGFSSVNIDVLCPSSTGGTTELSCTGNISTSLTSQNYQYAPLDMTCSTQ